MQETTYTSRKAGTIDRIVVSPAVKPLPVASTYVTGRKPGNTLTAQDRAEYRKVCFSRRGRSQAALQAVARPHTAKRQERALGDASGMVAIARRDHTARAFARYLDRLDRGLKTS